MSTAEDTTSGTIDVVSTKLLQRLDPAKLHTFTPRVIIGEGNCLYTAISLGMDDTQVFHQFLRLTTSIELCMNRPYYDVRSANYQGEVFDLSVMVSEYWTLLSLVCTPGDFSEMQHRPIPACSAAVGKQPESYYSLRSTMTQSFSRKIAGRGVTPRPHADAVCLMWTKMSLPVNATSFLPNHFCLLVRHAIATVSTDAIVLL